MNRTLINSPAWPMLKSLNNQLQQLVSNTMNQSVLSDKTDPWETAYGLVFSDLLSKPVHNALRELNQRLDYYDPDTSYEDDVLAFAHAVNEKVEQLQVLLDSDNTYCP